ncbi:hypothetical protein L3Q82_006323 [Scortum barcoo]|uniref:Uncharacterized protein n=1 Tax=Scortum barcoo TaxID=214431 RepID=A0ACB8X3C6_9TELE|nr:hypothetical protein L3Q82_006323 [Scortum barcoo]
MAAVNRPQPAHPGPNGGNLNSRPNSGIPNSGQQDPGLHSPSQDPGPSSHPQHHVSARPILYVPTPPPPPFIHYQWPMPFSYNPFAGFQGMGYGMVMPPFPPPPYMEAPAYILPSPHIQPVDYRRLLHPQVHAPSAPYQNPNQTRRIRLPYNVPFRETVNSEVQTEPTQGGVSGYEESPLVSSDSGHGTTSNSPSSSRSSSSSQKLGSAEVETYTLTSSNAKDSHVNCTSSTVKHGFDIPHHTETKTVQSFIRATRETQKSCEDGVGQENVPSCRNTHCNMWSVSSSDSIVPVCSSSQQEDEVVKGRRVSVPDILMNWGGDTSQETMLKIADKVLPQTDNLQSRTTEVEHEKSVYQTPTKTYNAEDNLSSKDTETLFKILKLPFTLHELLSGSREENEPVGLVGLPYRDKLLPSQNKSHKLPDKEQENGNETNPHENTQTDITPNQMSLNSCQMKRKMNESVWSVESLAPFIPTKEWLQKNGMLESDIIIEMAEEAENETLSTQNDKLIAKARMDRRQTRRFSSSDFVPMSDSWLIYSTPGEKQSPSMTAETESEIDASGTWGPSQGQAQVEKDSLLSPTLPQKIILSTPTEEDMGKIGSSEPEANESPNQDSPTVNEQQEKETLCMNSAAVEKISAMDQLILQNGVDKEENRAASRKPIIDTLAKLGNQKLFHLEMEALAKE